MNDTTWIGRPNLAHAPAYAATYFELTAGENHLLNALEKNQALLVEFMRTIPESKGDYRYAEGKWSVKGVFAHIIETERIFQYRALRFSRKDSTPVAGFDENTYVEANNHVNQSLQHLIDEFQTVRKATLSLYRGMTTDMLDFVGNANGHPNTARNIGWLIIGHSLHHLNVLTNRYLSINS